MVTIIYAALHFMVDCICAFAMFAIFRNQDAWYLSILIYNFCAFGLQMPFGALVDLLMGMSQMKNKKYNLPFFTVLLGLIFTFAGVFTCPAVLGIGNALFHVGGGVGSIQEDREREMRGQLLGVFVAPGALGLFLGTTIGESSNLRSGFLLVIFGITVLLFLILLKLSRIQKYSPESQNVSTKYFRYRDVCLIVSLLFLAVLIRSFAGFYTAMSWKTGFTAGLLCAAAAMSGKMLGGVFSAKAGIFKAMLISLVLSAGCFLFADIPAVGVLALLFFNMTMPVTLYMTVRILPDLPGFSFGLLTLALFMGFVPYWMQKFLNYAGKVVGVWAALITLVLLVIAEKMSEKGK